MSVAIVLRGSSLQGGGGAERRFARAFSFLRAERGYPIILIANPSLVSSLCQAGVISESCENIIMPARELSAFRFNSWAIQMVREKRPAVVHLPLLQKSLLPLYVWLALNRGSAVVHTVASTQFVPGGTPTLSNRLLAGLVFRWADWIDALYPQFRNTQHGVHRAAKVSITPCSFTDPDQYAPDPIKDQTIVFAGRLDSEKNPLLLLTALERLISTNPLALSDWQVRILGGGPLQARMSDQVQRMALEPYVTIQSIASIAPFIKKSQIFVSLQRTDNYPSQALLEAMASGNAIIATDVGDTKSLVVPEVGLLVKPNGADLAEALLKLVKDRELRNGMGVAARQVVLERHRVDIFCDYLEKIWDHCSPRARDPN